MRNRRWMMLWVAGAGILALAAVGCKQTKEHGGKEHGGTGTAAAPGAKEHGGKEHGGGTAVPGR